VTLRVSVSIVLLGMQRMMGGSVLIAAVWWLGNAVAVEYPLRSVLLAGSAQQG
jgi:hypothetical protein